MLKIRQIRYSSDSISVQVYKIVNRKRKIVRHIGTGRNDQEVENLLALAKDLIKKESKQLVLFKEDKTNNTLLVNQTEFLGVYYTFIYDLISKIILQIGLDKINNSLLIDLVILRIIEPASKLRSIELLKEYFGINHRRQNFYKEAPQWASLKNKVEKKCVEFAKRHYDFQYDLLFYDVTTLYFETFNPKYALDFVMREKRSINLEKHGKFLPQMYFLYNEDKKLSTFSNLKTFFFVINF